MTVYQCEADAEPEGLRFTILGPLAVEAAGRPLPLGPLKQRLVLALLLCHAGAPVSLDLLTETVWQQEPPRTARKNLQVYMSELRKMFGSANTHRLVRRPTGYLLRVGPAELDALRFHSLARDGRAAAACGEPALAARLLREALDLWADGLPLPDLHCAAPLRDAADRLEVDRAGVYEDWAEAELRMGNARSAVDALGDVVARHPLRERLQAARMSALHQCGRRTEALAAYEELRQLLARELGLTPSPQLAALYQSILADGPAVRVPAGDPASSGLLLPADLADFTGRAEESLLLDRALRHDQGPGAVLVGPCGAGKTAFAVHAAHRLRERFPDGRLLVALRTGTGAPRTAASVLGEIVRAAGLAASPPTDPARAAGLCRSWLAARRVLLVLDDAASEAAVRPLLTVGGPGRVLVTSRAQLVGLVAVRRIGVPPLTLDQALDLLGRIIGPTRVARDPEAAARIVAAGGLLPLAVRIAGMRLVVLRHMPLAEYAARLAEPAAALDEFAAGDVAVRPGLAASWRDLSCPDQDTLLRLAGLPLAVPFTAQQVAAALGGDAGAAQRALERLIEAGAVASPSEETLAHAARFTLPPLLHLYARELVRTGHGGQAG